MARMQILFDGFTDLASKIDKAGESLEEAVDEALTETFDVVQTEVETSSAIYSSKGGGKKGYATGNMYRAIKQDDKVNWNGKVAEISVGFDFGQKGGYHSIFIMYGTPRIAKDTKVYNAIKGTKVRNEVYKKQEEVLQKYLRIDK